MMIILLVFFQVRWRLLPLAVVLIGVVALGKYGEIFRRNVLPGLEALLWGKAPWSR